MFASKRTTALLSAYSAQVLNRCPDTRATATGVWQPTPVLGKALEDHMSDGLKWARRLRLELAVEIQQLASGARKVTQVPAHGQVDVSAQTLATLQDRFGQLEDMIAALELKTGFTD